MANLCPFRRGNITGVRSQALHPLVEEGQGWLCGCVATEVSSWLRLGIQTTVKGLAGQGWQLSLKPS